MLERNYEHPVIKEREDIYGDGNRRGLNWV